MQGFSFGYFDFEIIVRQQGGTMPKISGLKIQLLAVSSTLSSTKIIYLEENKITIVNKLSAFIKVKFRI